MRIDWRSVVGGLCGVAGAWVWAVGLAVYQPLMQPTGTFLDETTGTDYPNLASNNTYWPRDVRQLAILLALAGVLVMCRLRWRGVLVGASVALGWLGADLWLDRIDVSGWGSAVWLGLAGTVAFALTCLAARRMPDGRPAGPASGRVAGGVAAVLAVAVLAVTSPWDEPIVQPDQVAIENELTLMKAVLAGLFALASLALNDTRRTRVRVAGAVTLLIVLAVGLPINDAASTTVVLLVGMAIAAAANAGFAGVRPALLVVVALVAVVLEVPAVIVGFIVGTTAGGAMTALAGNPVVNGADTDLSLTVVGLVVAATLSTTAYAITGAASSRAQQTAQTPPVASPA
jgi:hypothetical protein